MSFVFKPKKNTSDKGRKCSGGGYGANLGAIHDHDTDGGC